MEHQNGSDDGCSEADEAVVQAVAGDVHPAAFVVYAKHEGPPERKEPAQGLAVEVVPGT